MFGFKKKVKTSQAIMDAINNGGEAAILIGTRAGTRVLILGRTRWQHQLAEILKDKGIQS
jgi:hypothetical protein